ncbi:MAG: hypothetical protein IH987_21425 [Planctomycetes bacterium]|nr:hypothetical protein [Planctomycetota bacterium]
MKQTVLVLGRVAGSGKQFYDEMDAAQHDPPQPTRTAHQHFMGAPPLFDDALLRGLRIKTFIVAGHEGHLPQGERGVVLVARARQVHLERTPAAMPSRRDTKPALA